MSRFATVVFALLVGATFSAFFVAQELKSRPPVVEVKRVMRFMSPNGDGRRDVNDIAISLEERDDVTLGIVDADGDQVRRLVDNRSARAGQWVRAAWDGRDTQSRPVPDGLYRLRVSLRRQGRSLVVAGKSIAVDTRPPAPFVRVDADQRIVAPGGGPVDLRVRGAGRRRPTELSVWRTDVSPPREVATLADATRLGRGRWDGEVGGRPAPPGTYLVRAETEDRAGNVGSSAPGLPARPTALRGRAGVTVRALAAVPPSEPVIAGQTVSVLVDARRRPFRWQLRQLGRARPVKRGAVRAGRPQLTVRTPRGPSAAYLLELASGRHRASAPVLAQAALRSKLLVVAPTITWLGSTRLDDDGNGLPDTLATGAVRAQRPYAGTQGLPAGLAEQFAPLLVSLDRSDVAYDLTTDLALARSDTRLSDYEGILLAGSQEWIPRRLAQRLRRYVLGGGRVASVGVDALRRGVTVSGRALTEPTQPDDRDIFGTRVLGAERARSGSAAPELGPIAERAELGLLEGSDGVLGGFRVWEEARKPAGDRAELLAALGRELTAAEQADAEAADRAPRDPLPIVSATRLGRGLVIRIGLPQWGARLARDAEVEQIQRNVVDLLRGVKPRVRSSR